MTNYRSLIALPALAAALLCAVPLARADDAGVKSLRGTDVAIADQAPDEKAMLGKRPGTQKPVPRTFRDQPPVIPHAMTNFDEITAEENQCLTCHDLENYQKKEAPRLSDSHLRDPRTNKPLKTVAAARYNCTQCHVPQADAPPLVENSFQGLPPLPAKKP